MEGVVIGSGGGSKALPLRHLFAAICTWISLCALIMQAKKPKSFMTFSGSRHSVFSQPWIFESTTRNSLESIKSARSHCAPLLSVCCLQPLESSADRAVREKSSRNR